MEYIKPKALPDVLAKQAYKEGHYVEAIQHLHGFLENQARSLLMLIGCAYFNAKQKETWNLSDTISLNNALKVLRILNQMTQEEYAHFKNLNSLRNKIVHQLYTEPYDSEYLGVPKNEFDKVFNETLEQIYFFTQKCEQIVG